MAINATNYDGTKDYKIAEVGDVYHPNLLINGDFQINQRGQEYYDTTSGWAYGVDMWKSIYCNINTSEENVIVVLSENGYMQQKLSEPVSGEVTVTVNVPYITRGKFEIYLEGESSDNTRLTVTKAGVFSHTFKSVSKATRLSVAFTGFYGNIDYIDLFEGSIAYRHVKEDHAIALKRCQRFLHMIISADYGCVPGYFYVTNSNRINLNLESIDMAAAPTVVSTGTFDVRDTMDWWTNYYIGTLTTGFFNKNLRQLNFKTPTSNVNGSFITGHLFRIEGQPGARMYLTCEPLS